MKTRNTLLIAILIATCAGSASAQNPTHPKLVNTIDSLVAVDQAPAKLKENRSAAWQQAIHGNFPVIKKIFETYGFPGFRQVGKKSSHNYWMVVQHSDFDVEFQKKVLKAMKKQVDRKNASGEDYAYLIDRIEQNEKRPQVYGTQIFMSASGTTLYATIDTANLDKRRKAVGLGPIKEYIKRSNEVYQALNNGTLDQLQKRDDSLAREKAKPKSKIKH